MEETVLRYGSFGDCQGEGGMRVLCISASNILHSNENSISKVLCDRISEILREKEIICETVDLRDFLLHPCIG